MRVCKQASAALGQFQAIGDVAFSRAVRGRCATAAKLVAAPAIGLIKFETSWRSAVTEQRCDMG